MSDAGALRATSSRAARRVTWALGASAAVWIVGIAIANARAHHATLDFHPINGSFQTFDPIRRLEAGQWPGRDFDAYLGLGPVYATYAVTSLGGGTFGASLVAVAALATFLHAFTCGVLARAAGASARAAIGVAVAVTSFAFLEADWIPNAWLAVLSPVLWPLASPDNSLLGVRAAAPCLVLACLFLAWRRTHASGAANAVGVRSHADDDDERDASDRASGAARRTRAMALVVGVVAGLVFPWSADYGPVSALGLIAIAVAFAPRVGLGVDRARIATWSVSSAAVTALALVTLATGGAPGEWWSYAFDGVARDQAWYFLHAGVERENVRELQVLLGLGGVAIATWTVRAWRSGRAGDAAVLYLLAVFAGAAALSARGSPSPRYAYPLLQAVVVTSVVAATRAFLPARAWRVAGWSGAALVSALALEPTWRLVVAPSADARGVRHPVDAPLAGGVLPGRLEKVAWLAREIRAECDRDGVPAERRLASTYTTMLDLLAGTLSPSRDDYVIHALGPARRNEYVERFLSTAPRFAATVRTDAVPFEGWIRRQNWAFYRELIALYDPWERTPYATVWRRRVEPRPAVDVRAHVTRREPDESGRIALEVTVDAAPPHGGAWIVELELGSPRGLLPRSGPALVRRAFVRLRDPAAVDAESVVGLPPYEPLWRVPVVCGPDRPSTLVLEPPNGEAFELESLTARVVVARDALDAFALERLVPAGFTGSGLAAGILTGTAGFLVADATDLWGLAPGDRVRFERSGERLVKRIADRRVFVEGPPLDPAGDGYPHAVQVVARAER